MQKRTTRVTALLAALAMTVAACGDDATEPAADSGGSAGSCEKTEGEAINVVQNAWTASAVEAEIMKQLIEKELCVPAKIVEIDENAMFAGMADGKVDFVTELWPSGIVEEEQKFIDEGTVKLVGELGTVGQIGWFTPSYVVEENPSLATWEGLKDPTVAKLFATAETGDEGRFLGTDPSYSQYDEPIIQNLELPFVVQMSGSEAATVAEVASAVADKKPILLYWWTPTAAAGKYDLVEVKLPENTDGCYDDPATIACGYPADPLMKAASAKLETKNPKVWAMLQKVTITNEQQLALLPLVEIDQRPAADVAAEWIAANQAVWKAWVS
jgi:glycine betaine/proline transport system substrate-binding protein